MPIPHLYIKYVRHGREQTTVTIATAEATARHAAVRRCRRCIATRQPCALPLRAVRRVITLPRHAPRHAIAAAYCQRTITRLMAAAMMRADCTRHDASCRCRRYG